MMTHLSRSLVAGFFFGATLMLSAQSAPAQVVTVQGAVYDGRNNTTVPGLTAQLIHPLLGRSVAATTDGSGRFILDSIPLRPEPYFLEIYWGTELIYRHRLAVTGDGVVDGRLEVPTIVFSGGPH